MDENGFRLKEDDTGIIEERERFLASKSLIRRKLGEGSDIGRKKCGLR